MGRPVAPCAETGGQEQAGGRATAAGPGLAGSTQRTEWASGCAEGAWRGGDSWTQEQRQSRSRARGPACWAWASCSQKSQNGARPKAVMEFAGGQGLSGPHCHRVFGAPLGPHTYYLRIPPCFLLTWGFLACCHLGNQAPCFLFTGLGSTPALSLHPQHTQTHTHTQTRFLSPSSLGLTWGICFQSPPIAPLLASPRALTMFSAHP